MTVYSFTSIDDALRIKSLLQNHLRDDLMTSEITYHGSTQTRPYTFFVLRKARAEEATQ